MISSTLDARFFDCLGKHSLACRPCKQMSFCETNVVIPHNVDVHILSAKDARHVVSEYDDVYVPVAILI
jgi:hypothetical protein